MIRIAALAAAAVVTLTGSALPAFAGDEGAAAEASSVVVPAFGAASTRKARSRPTALPALYGSYATLQAYDVYSTRQALEGGARERNPLMQGVVGTQGPFWALKVGVVDAAVSTAERLWKTDQKTAAIGVMIASNAVAAVVAARNAHALRRMP